MGCEFPVKAYRSAELGPTGKRLITFNPLKAVNSQHWMQMPCNRCMGCRLERARQWAVRMRHESKLYDQNCFITLTYDNANVPVDYSLKLRDWQTFMKRLRRRFQGTTAVVDPHSGREIFPIRFFACGEYGDENLRPHYHAIIFNHDFSDKKLFSYNKQKQPIYISDQLLDVWQLGHVTTQDVTFKSCSYVARYVTKKQNGATAPDFYSRVSPVDGQRYNVAPEFAVMSRRPGIGARYVEQFKSDFYPSGYIIVDGRKHAVPQYYVNQLSEEEKEALKRQRQHRSIWDPENTMERKMSRSAVQAARVSTLKRNL